MIGGQNSNTDFSFFITKKYPSRHCSSLKYHHKSDVGYVIDLEKHKIIAKVFLFFINGKKKHFVIISKIKRIVNPTKQHMKKFILNFQSNNKHRSHITESKSYRWTKNHNPQRKWHTHVFTQELQIYLGFF